MTYCQLAGGQRLKLSSCSSAQSGGGAMSFSCNHRKRITTNYFTKFSTMTEKINGQEPAYAVTFSRFSEGAITPVPRTDNSHLKKERTKNPALRLELIAPCTESQRASLCKFLRLKFGWLFRTILTNGMQSTALNCITSTAQLSHQYCCLFLHHSFHVGIDTGLGQGTV